MGARKKLQLIALTFGQWQRGFYTLFLGEEGGERRLPIVIREHEAQAMASILNDVEMTQPFIHDLFTTYIFTTSDNSLTDVLIYKFEEGVFYSKLTFATVFGDDFLTLESRISDAVAMALRFDAPIYATDEVLEAAGVVFGEEIEVLPDGVVAVGCDVVDRELDLSKPLTERLQEAIEDENYELASFLRDEIKKRK